MISERVERSLCSKSGENKLSPVETFKEDDLFIVAYGAARISMNWPAFKTMYYGQCRVIRSKHRRYELRSKEFERLGGLFTCAD